MKNYFYGIYGIKLIWHGEWADPELVWHGKSFNYYDIEMPLWNDYVADCEYFGNVPNDDDFSLWVKNNARLAREYLQNLLDLKCFYGG